MRRAAPWLILLLAGCQPSRPTPALPTYPMVPPAEALQIVRQRAAAFHDLSSQALVTLTRPDGQTVRFDAAVAVAMPDRARIRGFKMGQAVFDLTVRRDGSWLLAERGQSPGESLSAGAEAGRFLSQWLSLLQGPAPEQIIVHADARSLQTRGPGPAHTTLDCRIERPTLTIARWTVDDERGRQQFQLRLSRYTQVGDVVWPTRVEADAPTGRIDIELHDLEINAGVSDAAFVPPARARKLP